MGNHRKPKLNRERASFVLRRIDEILTWQQEVENERDARFAELGRYLCEVRDREYWRLEAGCNNFDDFLARKFPDSRRKAFYLMSIHDHLRPFVPRKEIEQLGWTKAAVLARVARSEGKRFQSAPWVHKAHELDREAFKREVERYFTGKESEPTELIVFRLTEGQLEVVDKALYTAALMLGSDKSRSHCLEMICADFLAGASLGEDPDAFYLAIGRLYSLLKPEEQVRFLTHAQAQRASQVPV